MLLAVMGVFGSFCWGMHLMGLPQGVGFVVAGLWLAVRSIGVGSGYWTTFAVSVVLVLYSWAMHRSDLSMLPGWLTGGPFSPAVMGLMLVVQALVDLSDLRQRNRLKPEPAERSQQHSLCWSRITLWFIAIGLLMYMIVIPTVDVALSRFREQPSTGQVLEEMTFAELIRLRTAEAATALWFFTLGATIGSFINVVVHRLPRGESLIFKPSSCPACGQRIAGRDNLPIIGWLKLGGRCRACAAPISKRYPIVEAATGGLFLLLYFVELISGGANLPVRTPNSYAGVVWIIFYTKWDLVRLYLFHCFLLSTLLTWALIRYDGHAVPLRSVLSMLVVSLICVAIWPELQLVPIGPWQPTPWHPSVSDALTVSAVGGLAGAVLGSLFQFGWALFRRESNAGPETGGVLPALAVTGTVLGWQAVLSIFALLLPVSLVRKLLSRRLADRSAWPLAGDLFLIVVVHHMAWRSFAERCFVAG